MSAPTLDKIVNSVKRAGTFLREAAPFWLPEIATSALLVAWQGRVFSEETPIVGEFIRLARDHPYWVKCTGNTLINGAAYLLTDLKLNRNPLNIGALVANMAYGTVSVAVEHRVFQGMATLIPGKDFASALGRTILFNPIYVMILYS